MFIGGLLTGMGIVAMFWAAYEHARREQAFLERVRALEAASSRSENS